LMVGVGFGQTTTTPPVGDPGTDPSTSDWLAVSMGANAIRPRSVSSGINGYDLEVHCADSGQRPCPRISGSARSVWLVTSAVPTVTVGENEWDTKMWMRYGSHSF